MATYTKTVDPNGGSDYASLSAWEAGEQALYSSGDIAIADCKRTGATKDTTIVTVAGWTAGVIPKIIVNAAHRHEGKWADQRGDGNYIYVLSVGASGTALQLGNAGNEVFGLLLEKVSTAGYNSAGIGVSAVANTRISGCIVRNAGSGSTEVKGIAGETVNTDTIVENSIFYNWPTAGIKVQAASDSNFKIYNCTVYGCGIGVHTYGYQDTDIKNTLALNCTTCFAGGAGPVSNYNVSSDATAPGANKATNKTAYTDYFVDPANGDFHLKNTSLALFGLSGADLSATFTTDIDGVTRSAPWDIGADQYVAAGGGEILLAGTLTGSASASAALTTAITLAGNNTGAGSATAALTTAIHLAATNAGYGSIAGELAEAAAAILLAGTINGTSSASGALTTAIRLAGANAGAGTTSAQLSTAIILAGAANGDSDCQAALTTSIALAGQIVGTGSAQSLLTVVIGILGSMSVKVAGAHKNVDAAYVFADGAFRLVGDVWGNVLGEWVHISPTTPFLLREDLGYLLREDGTRFMREV